MRIAPSLVISVALAAAVPTQASATTYFVDQMIGAVGRVTGDIVTDGALGTLTAADFTAWNLLVQGNGASITVTNANGQVVGTGNAVSATATAISFDYNDPTYSFLYFQHTASGAAPGYWCNATASASCLQGASAIPDFYYTGTAQYEARTGTRIIASTAVAAVPELRSWAMMITGMGAIGFFLRRRRGESVRRISYAT